MNHQLVSYQAPSISIGWELLTVINPLSYLPVRSRQVELSLHQLAVMLKGGMKLLDAIKALQLQTQQRSLSRVLEAVFESVSRGESLSHSLSDHRIFPQIVVQLIHVGEQSGTLDRALEQCRDHMAGRRTLRAEVTFALAYPALVTLAALSIAAYLILFVIPQLQIFLSTLGRDLPAMTQSLVDLAQWLRVNGSQLATFLSLVVAAFAVARWWPRSRLVLDQYLLRVPVIGSILRLSGTAGLASSLAVMLRSGIRLVEALKISGPLQHNSYLAKQVFAATDRVSRGQPLAPHLAARGGFAPILPSMIEVAERTGSMDKTLVDVSELCEVELKSRVKSMSRMVEPLVILLAGGIVGYVYIAFFLALMSAGSTIR